jgi:anti-sigma factor RsiW
VSNRDWHTDRERLADDLSAYALGALEPGEVERLELHLRGCPECRERVDWLRPAVDLLPTSVPQLSPPDSLRESVMAAVRAEAAPSRPASEPRPSWWDGLRSIMARPATGMAVAILLVAGIATGYLVRGSADRVPEDFVGVEPLGPQAAQVSATLERHGDSATLHVSELPDLRRDEVYEVWVQRGGVMEPASTFVLGLDGTAEAAVPGPLGGAQAILVTAEPRPGSRQPTTEPLLQAPL